MAIYSYQLTMNQSSSPKSFDRKTSTTSSSIDQLQNLSHKKVKANIDLDSVDLASQKQNQWQIVVIDDSPIVLNQISHFLAQDEFTVYLVEEPLKALMKIIKIKPDLILLDADMPNIDGYKLCALIRKYSAFKDIPIVMLVESKCFVDRATLNMAKATDSITKPFTQKDLLNTALRYLS